MIETYTLKTILVNFLYLPLITMLVWLNLDVHSFEVLFYLLMLDFFVGMAKSKRLGEDITYSRFVGGIFGKFFVLLVPITLALTAKGININLSSFVMGAVYAFIVAEGISILSNILSYRQRKRIRKPDLINLAIERSGKFAEKLFRIFD